jgi:hypothetical protein
MAGIFERLFDNKSVFISDIDESIEKAIPEQVIEQAIPKSAIEHTVQQIGGKIKPNKMDYFQRWNIYLFIFIIAVFLAILSMNSQALAESIFKKPRVKDLANDLGDQNSRWIKMVRYTIVFITIVIAINVALIFGVYLFTEISSMAIDGATPFKALFWKYKDPYGKVITIGKTYIFILIMVLLVTYVCFLGFSRWYPEFFDSLYYQSNKDTKQGQPQKYIFNYGLFLILMMIFFIILVNVKMLDNNKLYMFYNIIFLLSYIILTFITLKEFKFGNPKKLAFVIILAFLMFFVYPVLLSLIKMEKSGSDLFGATFLGDVIFNFGIPRK